MFVFVGCYRTNTLYSCLQRSPRSCPSFLTTNDSIVYALSSLNQQNVCTFWLGVDVASNNLCDSKDFLSKSPVFASDPYPRQYH